MREELNYRGAIIARQCALLIHWGEPNGRQAALQSETYEPTAALHSHGHRHRKSKGLNQ